jgi:CO/xanthine dehydrogenase Mo-binding subunit
MPPVIGEIDVTVLAAEVGDAMSAGLGVRLRHRPIRPAALLEAFSNA